MPAEARPAALPSLLRRLGKLAVALVLGLPAWPVYGLLRLGLPRPPTLPSLRRCFAQLGWVLRAAPPAPGLPPAARAALLLELLARLALAPLRGLCWQLDELLYGRALDATGVASPLILLSAARSGSTRLARALEDDPAHVAPAMLEIRHPWLWLWRLGRGPLGRRVDPARVRAFVEAQVSEDFRRRHEVDPFRTDTLEVLFGLGHHIDLVRCLGPDPFARAFSHSRRTADNGAYWDDFAAFADRLGRKTLLLHGAGDHRLMVKGHFLAAAASLAAHYPDGRFLTVVREPAARLQSLFNFHRVSPTEALLGPLPWPWIVAHGLDTQVAYGETEQAWYSETGLPRRLALAFSAYADDPAAAVGRVYRELLDREEPPATGLPGHASEPPLVDRSLAELGVDLEALASRTADYRRWLRSLEA